MGSAFLVKTWVYLLRAFECELWRLALYTRTTCAKKCHAIVLSHSYQLSVKLTCPRVG